MIKKAIASYVIITQYFYNITGVFEFIIKDFGVPFFSLSLIFINVLIMVSLKDKENNLLFKSTNISKFGPIPFYGFQILEELR